MGVEAITHLDDGSKLVPQTKDNWREWVSATATRNYVLNDPILDWLDLYGESIGIHPDTSFDGYDGRTSFIEFLFAKGNEFESSVLTLLEQKYPITRIAHGPANFENTDLAESTFSAMLAGTETADLRNCEVNAYNSDFGNRSENL